MPDVVTNFFSSLTAQHYFFFLFAIVAIASALNWYLKYFCHCHVSFTGGSQLKLPRPLPPVVPTAPSDESKPVDVPK